MALQVAASAARSGKANLAQELRALIEQWRKGSSRARKPIPVGQPRGDREGLLSVSYPDVSPSDLVLLRSVREQLQRVLVEQRQYDELRSHGFAPTRKLLLVGPSGTGKTLSARMLASQLHLPLFTIRLDGLITKYMGETAAKLRIIFDAMADVRGVYLFDEVDALAGERGRSNDVGEIRRVLNSFLQFLEEDDSESVLVAATNHPSLLDKALFRRFDVVVSYQMPTRDVVKAVIQRRLAGMKVGVLDWTQIAHAAKALSHSDITLAAEYAAKAVILQGRKSVQTRDLVAALQGRRADLRIS